jgi:CheY-like chemotaxis protein
MGRGSRGHKSGTTKMTRSNGQPERRRHARIAPKGSVRIHFDGEARRGRLVNIGEGGMFVLTDATALDDWHGRDLDVELRFDGAHAEWLRGKGRIVRIQLPGLALAFEASSPAPLVRSIAQLANASNAHDQVMSVVLIDADARRRSVIADGFRATGCSVEEAATPLDAIARLGATHFEPDVIAIADSHPTTAADEMRSFVQRDHPDALLITIGDALLAPDGMLSWLSSADPNSDLAARVREILVADRRR